MVLIVLHFSAYQVNNSCWPILFTRSRSSMQISTKKETRKLPCCIWSKIVDHNCTTWCLTSHIYLCFCIIVDHNYITGFFCCYICTTVNIHVFEIFWGGVPIICGSDWDTKNAFWWILFGPLHFHEFNGDSVYTVSVYKIYS